MTRAPLALVLGLFSAASARADALPPPTPGKKIVLVDHVVTTAKAYPDHDFYLVTGFAPTKVEFGPDVPAKLGGRRGSGVGGLVQFVAVPKGAAGNYLDVQGFADALRIGNVPGQLAADRALAAVAEIDAKDPRTVVVETHEAVKVDEKAGIVLRTAKSPSTSPPGESNAPEELELVDFGNTPSGNGPPAPAPSGGNAVAGVAAALAVIIAGLWLVRRSRP